MKKAAVWFYIFFGIAFVAVNIIYSQWISPLYMRIINEEQDGVVLFLKTIKETPYFQEMFFDYAQTRGDAIKEKVFEEDAARRKKIERLEELLVQNPNARDLLIYASMLYADAGDATRAREYLQKAGVVDPGFFSDHN